MRTIKISVYILSVYLFVVCLGIFSPKAFQITIVEPVNQCRNTLFYYYMLSGSYSASLFEKERTSEKGVTINNVNKSYTGYTFYISAHEHDAVLIDENGKIVQKWGKKPQDIWTDPTHLAQKVDEEFFMSIRAFLTPKTGDAFIIYGSKTRTPGAFGLIKFNKNSDIEWVYDGPVHHDVTFSEDMEHIYVLEQQPSTAFRKKTSNIAPPYLDEAIIVLNQQGQKIKQMSLFDLFEESPLKDTLNKLTSTPTDPTLPHGDILHSNTIEVVSKDAAGKAPMLKEGHLMISFRNLDLLIMVDPDKEEITWASYGPWKGQHDPEIQNDGSMIMFDNQGSFKKDSGISRILHVDLNTMKILWEYSGTKEKPLQSLYNSSIHVLPNRNILVTETEAGRIFEITRDKEIVWEYWNPKRKVISDSKHGEEFDGKPHIDSLYSAVRYSQEDLPFLKSP